MNRYRTLQTSKIESMDPIDEFFARFSTFHYLPTKEWRQLAPFNDLADQEQWSKEKRKQEFRRLQRAWRKAVESEFEGSSISHYRSLCEDLEIDPIPSTVGACKQELRTVFVNIVDLMQYRRDRRRGRKPERFDNLEQLKQYSSDHGKYYPKESAKAEMLRELLKILAD